MEKLENQVAFVSGGGTGIGKAISELFSSEGAKLFVVGRREEPLKSVCSKRDADYVCCDISKEKKVAYAVKRALERYGVIDILVNNAGVHLYEGPLTELDEKVIDEILRINVKGTLLLSKHVLKSMAQRRKGNIINLASILGVIGTEHMATYTASKGAVIAPQKSP